MELPDLTIRALQCAILADAAAKLGRPLTKRETTFVTSRGGFIALEMIADTVRAASREECERYLNSE